MTEAQANLRYDYYLMGRKIIERKVTGKRGGLKWEYRLVTIVIEGCLDDVFDQPLFRLYSPCADYRIGNKVKYIRKPVTQEEYLATLHAIMLLSDCRRTWLNSARDVRAGLY